MRTLCLYLALTVVAAAETTRIGMEGTYLLRSDGPAIRARSVDEDAAVILRVADVVEDDISKIYELRYLGMYTGAYDLVEFLERVDGQPLTHIDPIPVQFEGVLTEEHDGSVDPLSVLPLPTAWPLRRIMKLLLILWCLPIAWWIVKRVFRPKASTASDRIETTLADQLRPLVESAAQGKLDAGERARLERLLIAHWRERLALGGQDAQTVLQRMRAHKEAGELLQRLEAWLHQPPGRNTLDVAALLEPYRQVAARKESSA